MALALVAAACGSSDGTDAAAPAAATDDGESSSEAPSSILDISAPTADGSTIDLSDFAGQDLVLWFWAPW